MTAALGNSASLVFLLPEIVLTLGIVALVATTLRRGGSQRRLAGGLTLLTCLGTGVAILLTHDGRSHGLFGGLIARDPFADFFTGLAVITAAVVSLLALRSRDTLDPAQHDADAPEFFALLLTATLGVALMAAATDLLMAYLSLEMVSIVGYVLVGFTAGSRRSAEASLKYVIYGSVASGAMLFGMSWLYGLAVSTDLATIRQAAAHAPPGLVVGAVGLCMAGLGYKIAVAPFHMWCPDVYEGAPTPVTAFLSVAPKAGGFALLMRFFANPVAVATDGGSPSAWTLFLFVMAVATMTLGNLAAFGQQNIKRLLAYSSIAHAGYLLLGVAMGAPAGQAAVLFYLAVYLLMNLAAFAAVIAIAETLGAETIDGYRGLGFRIPLPALVITVALFALAGLPPTAGFAGKYYLFAALIEQGHGSAGTASLVVAVVAVFNSVLSLGYYARIIRALYLDKAPVAAPPAPLSRLQQLTLIMLLVPLVGLGLYWEPLRSLVSDALVVWTRV